MNKFFTSTASLSAYSKWVLICLIVDKTIGDELSKTDFIKRECPYNKFNKVVDELLNIDAISEHKVKQSNRGRPKIYYNFIYDTPNEISKLISSEILAKIEGKDLRVPIKILWCFFVLNQNEFGYIEGFTMANIATACGLESTQLKTAIKLLKNENLISHSVTGCTIKKYHSVKPKVRKGLVGSEANNLKRSSTFKLNNKETYAIYLITLPSNRKRKLNSFTTIFFSLLMEKHLKNDSIFVELLHFDNSWLDSDTKQNDEIQFLRQQPTQVFDYFAVLSNRRRNAAALCCEAICAATTFSQPSGNSLSACKNSNQRPCAAPAPRTSCPPRPGWPEITQGPTGGSVDQPSLMMTSPTSSSRPTSRESASPVFSVGMMTLRSFSTGGLPL